MRLRQQHHGWPSAGHDSVAIGPGMSARVAWLIGQLTVGLLIVGLLMWLMQPRLVFFPLDRQTSTPADFGLAFEDVTIETVDGERLAGWFVPAPPGQGRDLTLLFLHGNAGNISHRGDSLWIFAQLGLDVLIIDYRGYGRSSGSPSENGLYLDADAAWRWLTEQRGVPANQILLFGRSLGAAVAAELAGRLSGNPGAATNDQPAAVIIESGFDALASLASHHYPLLTAVIPLRFDFRAAEAIARARCPVLVLHSPDDEIVPYALGSRLFAAAPEPKRFVDLRGGHNDGFLVSQPDYQQAIAGFLNTHVATPR
jgi:fermentation-respiration switch protein FrsA (DUF1100 family)